MPNLMIGPAERERIAEIIAYATAHPVLVDVNDAAADDTAVLKLEDRKPGYERPRSEHILFPGGFWAAFSIEKQPAGFLAHLSISVEGRPTKGQLPHPVAVEMIAAEFGVSIPADRVWLEEFQPGEFAVNLLSLMKEATDA